MHLLNKSLHDALVTSCTGVGEPLSLLQRCTAHYLTVLSLTVWSQKHLAGIEECQWVLYFLHGGIQWHLCFSHTSLPDTILLDCPFAQQHVIEYWWECSTFTAVQPTSTSAVGQHHKIGGIIFGAALKYLLCVCWCNVMWRSLFLLISLVPVRVYWWKLLWSNLYLKVIVSLLGSLST